MNPLFMAVVVLMVIASLQFGLYVALRHEVDEIKKAYEAKLNAGRETKDSLRSEMMRISEEFGSLNPSTLPVVTIQQSMNLSRRNQVLRMHLRGDSPSRIASVLKISKCEVDLLLKVHRTVIPPSSWSPAGAPPASRRVGSSPRELEAELEQSTAKLQANC